MSPVTVLGAGLAGCEAAMQIANAGIDVLLVEQKPTKYSPAHTFEGFAELVCSNSLKADRIESAGGLLKAEMRRLHSVCLESADQCKVPAGGALAVDREDFSKIITDKIVNHPRITVVRKEATDIPEGRCIIATGPLTGGRLSDAIAERIGGTYLSFFDAAAPIVTKESVTLAFAFYASRYDRGGEDDYLNCPMNKDQYERFYEALIAAEPAQLHAFDTPKVYEGCMPVEVMAKRGPDTLRFGPLKPVGLVDPHTGHRPWAVVQLRRENREGTLLNLVGFQTNLKFSEQKKVFSLIPALASAEFVRYGVMHRNTFIDSPRLLLPGQSLRSDSDVFFAGQITGVEGYMESAASGIMAGINMVRKIKGKGPVVLPKETMIGALLDYSCGNAKPDNFQPMGANFGILPPLVEKIRDKKQRYAALAGRAMASLETSLHENPSF